MNSYEILKQLRQLLAITPGERTREILEQAVRHIEGQDADISHLREDITEQEIPDAEA